MWFPGTDSKSNRHPVLSSETRGKSRVRGYNSLSPFFVAVTSPGLFRRLVGLNHAAFDICILHFAGSAGELSCGIPVAR